MSVEGVGGGVGVGVGIAVSVGPSLGSGPSLGGIEGGGLSAPSMVSSLPSMEVMTSPISAPDSGGSLGSIGELNASIDVNSLNINSFGAELIAPVEPILPDAANAVEDFKNTMPITTIGQFNVQEPIIFNTQPVVEASVEVNEDFLDIASAIEEAQSVLAEARVSLGPVMPAAEPVVIEQASVIVSEVESQVAPIAVPNGLEYPAPQVVVSPGLKEETETERLVNAQSGSQAKVGSAVSAESVQTLKPEPVLEEQEQVVEQVVAESDQQKAVYKNREETEESRLKDVVDEEILIARVEEFAEAIEEVDIEVKAQALENGQQDEDVEIDGSEVVARLGSETPDKRSGLVKKQGPDGSRIEAIEEIGGKKFKSAKEAKEKALATVFEKVPVKKGKEGKKVGNEAVARVLKYFFAKYEPSEPEQLGNQITKKRSLQIIQRQQPWAPTEKPESSLEPTLTDLNLTEVFRKAA